jgi:amino acid transporter
MAAKSEEKDVDACSVHTARPENFEFYDPSKESVWTRLGLTVESFKRAPGTTG